MSSSREPMPSFGEDLAQVVVDGARREEQPRADLAVAEPFGDEPADRRAPAASAGRSSTDRGGCAASPVARSSRSARAAHGSAPMRSNVSSARRSGARASMRRARTAQRLAVRELGAGSLERPAVAMQCDRALEVAVALGARRHAAGALDQALDPRQLHRRGKPFQLGERGQGVGVAIEVDRDLARVTRGGDRQPWMCDARQRVGGGFVARPCRSRAARWHARRSTPPGRDRGRSRARSPRSRRSRSGSRRRARRPRVPHAPGWTRASSSGRLRVRGAHPRRPRMQPAPGGPRHSRRARAGSGRTAARSIIVRSRATRSARASNAPRAPRRRSATRPRCRTPAAPGRRSDARLRAPRAI